MIHRAEQYPCQERLYEIFANNCYNYLLFMYDGGWSVESLSIQIGHVVSNDIQQIIWN